MPACLTTRAREQVLLLTVRDLLDRARVAKAKGARLCTQQYVKEAKRFHRQLLVRRSTHAGSTSNS